MPEDIRTKQEREEALERIRAQGEDSLETARALHTQIEEEERGPTEAEALRLETLITDANNAKERYAEGRGELQRQLLRESIESSQEGFDAVPEAAALFSRPQSAAMRKVQSSEERFFRDGKRGFLHAGEFFNAVWASGIPGGILDERLRKMHMEAVATGMSQAVGAEGGFTVPPSFRTDIWDGLNTGADNLLPMTDQFNVEGDSLTMPANAEVSRKNGSRYGGVQGFWVAEADQIPASRPKVRQLKLEPQELFVLVYVTDKLLRNATALNEYVTRASSDEILFMINDAIINGNGVGMPKGILGSGGLVTVPKESSQVAATVVIANINKMWGRMHARARMGAVWLINQDIEEQLEQLTAGTGTLGFPVYLPQGTGGPTITEAPNARLKGVPVMPVEFCETLGTKGDIILVNLGYYATGLKGGMRSDVSMHLRFDFAETAFRLGFEIDGQPWINTPLTPFKGTLTLSPYVALATRA